MPREPSGGDADPPVPPPGHSNGGVGEGAHGGRHWPSCKARELFPLPSFEKPARKLEGCRSVRQRRSRIRRMVDDMNDAVSSLNWLAGRQHPPHPPNCHYHPPEASDPWSHVAGDKDRAMGMDFVAQAPRA